MREEKFDAEVRSAMQYQASHASHGIKTSMAGPGIGGTDGHHAAHRDESNGAREKYEPSDESFIRTLPVDSARQVLDTLAAPRIIWKLGHSVDEIRSSD